MKTKFKPSFISYMVMGVIVCLIIGFFLLPKEDKIYLVYAIIFSVVTLLFDGTVLAKWLEKRRDKKARNPLLED